MAIEKLNLRADSQDERFAQLKQLYPEIFSDGNLNIEALKEACGLETEEDGYYGLYWPGKNEAKRLARKEATGTLEPVEGDGVNEDTTHNIYIEGDNLEVLRTLKKSYQNRIKMIYIDPPYNTGNDFIYPDNYQEPVEDYLRFTGQMDDKGNMLVANPKDSGKYHRAWLKMMYSRLCIAHELLSSDGVIFISIDDNELANLKLLCDEIFGEQNFQTVITVKMSEPTGVKMAHADKRLPKLKEYILMYSKNELIKIKPIKIPKEKWDNEYKTYLLNLTEGSVNELKAIRDKEEHTDDDIAYMNKILSNVDYCSLSEMYRKNGITSEEEKEKFNYANAWRIIQTVSTTGSAKDLADKTKNTLKQKFFAIRTAEDKVYFIKGDYDDSIAKPRIKALFADDYLTVNVCDFWPDIKTTGLDNEGGIPFKNGKKPLRLIKRLIEMITGPDSIIMDFFSGSGTTAQSVMEINQELGGKRKFIMVQLPEDLDKSFERASQDEKKTIKKTFEILDSLKKPHFLTEIGKQRIRFASEEIEKEGKSIDIGFKVYRLGKSNFTEFENISGTDKSVLNDLFAAAEKEPLTEGWKERKSSVIAELCLRHGFVLDSAITRCPEYTKNEVLKIVDQNEEKTMFVCLDEKISEETAKNLHLEDGEKFICLDSAIGDQLKVQLADKGRIETI